MSSWIGRDNLLLWSGASAGPMGGTRFALKFAFDRQSFRQGYRGVLSDRHSSGDQCGRVISNSIVVQVAGKQVSTNGEVE